MKKTLNGIARRMMRGCPPECKADHSAAARALRAGDAALALKAIDDWWCTVSWLKTELAEAGIILVKVEVDVTD